MTDLTKRLCPSCFQETMLNGVCMSCGYHSTEEQQNADHLPPFTILNTRYLVGKHIGQGGFGITYLAKDMLTGKLCCIKEYFPSGLIHERTAEGDVALRSSDSQEEYEQGKQQFIVEASTLQDLRDNIAVVDILDFFEEHSTAYFVMEFLEGCNLRAFQRNHTPEQNFRMSLQMLLLVGSALAEVHRFGMLHGDISPENIIITQSGEIKLIDFGAARSFVHSDSSQEKKVYLKPNYAPYEQYTLKPYQGPWTDLYSLAATFYFIVSGQKMLDAPSIAKGMDYTPLCELSPLVSKGLSEVLDHALAFDYHDRFRSVMEFLTALEKQICPDDYNIDLVALMQHKPPRQNTPTPPPEEADSKALCSVEPQSALEPKGFAALFRRKKHQLAYLELTIAQTGARRGCSKRRWLIEPNRPLRIGRRENSEVMMPPNNLISRDHCEIFYNENRKEFLVKDTSKFGTYLADGTRMEKMQYYPLKDGDGFFLLSPEYMFKVVIES